MVRGSAGLLYLGEPWDLTELQRNMVYHGMEIPFASPLLFYDVQKLYSLTFSDGKTREALDEAVKLLNIRMDAPFHRLWAMQSTQERSWRVWT